MKSLMQRILFGRSMQDSVRTLLKSEKFLRWESDEIYVKSGDKIRPDDLNPKLSAVDEMHFTPAELAEAWGVDVETIRNIFRDEPGVLKLGGNPGKKRRPYITLRIPREVAERVHRRLAA